MPRIARATDEKEAQALFDEGKARMAAGDYAVACAKLEESLRIQPAGGTVMHLALCREAQGKTATAWVLFNQTLSSARRDGRADREKVAHDHIASLVPKLVKVAIHVGDDAARLTGLDVERDGESIAKGSWDTAIPVDPGAHVITADAPGKTRWEQRVDVNAEGATVTVDVPALADAPVVAVAPSTASMAAPIPLADSKPPAGKVQRVAAVVVGAVGVVGFGLGSTFGVMALSKKSSENAHCPGGASGPCDAEGVRLSKDAVTFGDASTIAFAIGAAGLAGGAVLWLAAPKSKTAAFGVSPTVALNGAGIQAKGTF